MTNIDSIIKSARKGNLIVFCGAGVSMLAPSNSPSWWEIYYTASKALYNRFSEGFPEFSLPIEFEELFDSLTTQQLADLIVQEFSGATFVENLQVVDIADPNENHRLLVSLANKDKISGFVTTNFDTLLERSASILGIKLSIRTPEFTTADTIPRYSIPLIKLHGSAVDATNLVETSSQKSKEFPDEFIKSWEKIISGKDVLVIGYSGADLNFGVVRIFFQTVLNIGDRIWWLYRSNNKPSLINPFDKHVILIEGSLPEFLKKLSSFLGAKDFSTPKEGKNAHKALNKVMEDWSKTDAIGRWSAALFLLHLANSGSPNQSKSELLSFLMGIAFKESEKIKRGVDLYIKDIALPLFLHKAGSYQMGKVQVKKSTKLFLAALYLFTSFDKKLQDHKESSSERQMNLASIWGDYGHSLVYLGNHKLGLDAFKRSFGYGYLSGHIESILIALHNIIQYELGPNCVRKCLRYVESGIKLADMNGIVQSSIELRFLAITFYIDRNEIWTAMSILKETKRRAIVLKDQKNIILAGIVEGQLLLKQGYIEEGLKIIADMSCTISRTAFFALSFEEVRRYLTIIGVCEDTPYIIDVQNNMIPKLFNKVLAEVNKAEENNRLPWEGRHCQGSVSSGRSEEDMDIMFRIGVFEFDRNHFSAISLSLEQAINNFSSGYFQDVIWNCQNVLKMPEISLIQKAYAHTYMAYANASLTRIQTVERNIIDAKETFQKAKVKFPKLLIELSLWHYMNIGNKSRSITWLKLLLKKLVAQNRHSEIASLYIKIQSWELIYHRITDVVIETLWLMDYNLGSVQKTPLSQPYRHFFVGTSDLVNPSFPEFNDRLEDIKSAYDAGNIDKGLRIIDELISKNSNNLIENQHGVLLSYKIQGLAKKSSINKLNIFFNELRTTLIAQFSFSTLTRLESIIARELLYAGNINSALEIVENRSFISEFALDPNAKIDFNNTEALLHKISKKRFKKDYISTKIKVSQYYGIETGLIEGIINTESKNKSKV